MVERCVVEELDLEDDVGVVGEGIGCIKISVNFLVFFVVKVVFIKFIIKSCDNMGD